MIILVLQRSVSPGPERTTRTRRTGRFAAPPYDRDARPVVGEHQAQQPANFLLPWPPCPRNGLQYVAGARQPQAAWEIAPRPHEAAGITVANFMFTLTAHDVREDIAGCGELALTPQQRFFGQGTGDTLAQLVRKCKDMDSKRGAVDFQYMVSLMRLSFHCARCCSSLLVCFYIVLIPTVSLSGWTRDVNLTSLWQEYLSQESNPPTVRSLQKWYSKGSKLARLAAGGEQNITGLCCSLLYSSCTCSGSIYLLLWLAYTNLHAPFVQADGNLASDAANILRSPDNGTYGDALQGR